MKFGLSRFTRKPISNVETKELYRTVPFDPSLFKRRIGKSWSGAGTFWGPKNDSRLPLESVQLTDEQRVLLVQWIMRRSIQEVGRLVNLDVKGVPEYWKFLYKPDRIIKTVMLRAILGRLSAEGKMPSEADIAIVNEYWIQNPDSELARRSVDLGDWGEDLAKWDSL